MGEKHLWSEVQISPRVHWDKQLPEGTQTLCPLGPLLQIGFVASLKKQSRPVPHSSDLSLLGGAMQDLNPLPTKDRHTSLDLGLQSLSSLHSSGALHLLVSSQTS